MNRSTGLKRFGEYISGEIPGTVPYGIRSGITAPQKVLKGDLPVYVYDERGRRVFNPEALKAGSETAGLVSSGTLATKPNPNMAKIGYNQYKKDVKRGISAALKRRKTKEPEIKYFGEDGTPSGWDVIDTDVSEESIKASKDIFFKGLESTPRAWTRPTKSVEIMDTKDYKSLGSFFPRIKHQKLNALTPSAKAVPHEFTHGIETFLDELNIDKVKGATPLVKDVWKNRKLITQIDTFMRQFGNKSKRGSPKYQPQEYVAYKLMDDFHTFKKARGRRPTTKESAEMFKMRSEEYLKFYERNADTPLKQAAVKSMKQYSKQLQDMLND